MLQNVGYLALHRKIEDSFVYQDSVLLHLWIHCLIKATYRDRDVVFDGSIITLKIGQFITGRKSLAKTLHVSEQIIRSRIALLEQKNKIHVKSTNKYSLITVLNYEYYQSDRKKITNREPTDNQQITTNNKVNKVNKVNKDISKQSLHLIEKDMGWKQYNENAHHDEIPSVGDDGEPEKPKEKVKRHYKEVYTLFVKILKKETPGNWLVNKTQMTCADNLYTERGMVQIEKALLFYLENKDLEYCPQISSPFDLDSKWVKLNKFMKKQNE